MVDLNWLIEICFRLLPLTCFTLLWYEITSVSSSNTHKVYFWRSGDTRPTIRSDDNYFLIVSSTKNFWQQSLGYWTPRMRVGPLWASSPEEPPLRTWAVSDERVGIRGGKFCWSYNIGQLHLYIGKYLLMKRKVTRNFPILPSKMQTW